MKHILYKTISWRIISTVPFAIATFWVTGSLAASTTLILLDVIGRTILYAAHEWFWVNPPARVLFLKNSVYSYPRQLRSLLAFNKKIPPQFI